MKYDIVVVRWEGGNSRPLCHRPGWVAALQAHRWPCGQEVCLATDRNFGSLKIIFDLVGINCLKDVQRRYHWRHLQRCTAALQLKASTKMYSGVTIEPKITAASQLKASTKMYSGVTIEGIYKDVQRRHNWRHLQRCTAALQLNASTKVYSGVTIEGIYKDVQRRYNWTHLQRCTV